MKPINPGFSAADHQQVRLSWEKPCLPPPFNLMRMSESTPQNGRQQILPAPSMGIGKTLRGVSPSSENNLLKTRLFCARGLRKCRNQQGKRVKRQYLRKSSSFGRSSLEKPMPEGMRMTTEHRRIREGGVDQWGQMPSRIPIVGYVQKLPEVGRDRPAKRQLSLLRDLHDPLPRLSSKEVLDFPRHPGGGLEPRFFNALPDHGHSPR